MFKNLTKIAFRTLFKEVDITIVNFIGLVLGLSVVIVIVSYANFEFSYDKSYSNASNVYRLVGTSKTNDTKSDHVLLPEPLSIALQSSFPIIESATKLRSKTVEFVLNGEPTDVQVLSVNNTFFKLFNFNFLYGDNNLLLNRDKSVVITETFFKNHFPGQNPVGDILGVTNKNSDSVTRYVISGVVKDIPNNVHFNAGAFILTSATKEKLDWRAFYSATQYISIKKGANIKDIESKMDSFYALYNFPKDFKLIFQPVQSIHLQSHIADELFENGNIQTVYIFLAVALLILFIACINYVNLTIAKSLQRTREVGVRKLLGASQTQLILQFIIESFTFFCIAIPFAVLSAYLIWPKFAEILKINTDATFLFSRQNIAWFFIISVFSSILSGVYPSLFLARLKIANIVKGQNANYLNLGIRKVLIVIQFSIAICLIISTIFIYQQLNLLSNYNLGFNKDNLLILPGQDFGRKALPFKNELLKNPHIKSVSIVSWNMGSDYGSDVTIPNPADTTKNWRFSFVDADYDFIKTLDLKLTAGQNFSNEAFNEQQDLDSKSGKVGIKKKTQLASFILNQQSVKELNLTNPVGQTLNYPSLTGKVVGVVQNFEGLSLNHSMENVIIRPHADDDTYGNTYIKIAPRDISQSIKFIDQTWKGFFPVHTFSFNFADERLQRLYDSERRLSVLFSFFTILTVCISCSGLFSLVSIIIIQRKKEIGIRKILGLGMNGVVRLLLNDFVYLILISIVIAIPITWIAINSWLQNFIYKIDVSPVVFISSGVLIVSIALITISFQAIKVSFTKPVINLRND
jgi:putative ABC transport system permease protein